VVAVAEALATLAELHREGLLSAEEFTALKAEAIGD
jgi:hypothetical protein